MRGHTGQGRGLVRAPRDVGRTGFRRIEKAGPVSRLRNDRGVESLVLVVGCDGLLPACRALPGGSRPEAGPLAHRLPTMARFLFS